ncbi:MAG: hypothetical protein RR107_00710 [Clostridia bacterium]
MANKQKVVNNKTQNAEVVKQKPAKQQAPRIVKFQKQKVGDMARRSPTVSRPQLWKFLMGSRMGNCFKINLLAVVAFIPVIFALVSIFSLNINANGNLPYTSFLGAGFPVVVDVMERAFVTSQEIFLKWAVYILPSAMFVSCFLIIPALYAARNLLWSEGHFHAKAILSAFKFNWLNGLIIAFVVGIVTFGGAYAIYFIRNSLFYNGANFGNIASIVALALFGVFALITTLYAMSISMTYKESILLVYRDAVVLTVRIALQNIVIIVLVLAPIILMGFLMSTMFVAFMFTLFLFIGFSFMILTWEDFAQYVFDIIDGSKR